MSLTLTFKDQPRSNAMVSLESPYMVSYCLKVTCGPTQLLFEICLQNRSDVDFDLSRSLKLKCDNIIQILICGFLLLHNSNIWPNQAPLPDLTDLDFDLSSSLKFKCNGAIGLLICGFLLMFNSNIWPNSAPLRNISPQKNWVTLSLTIWSHLRSNLMVQLDFSYMTFY